MVTFSPSSVSGIGPVGPVSGPVTGVPFVSSTSAGTFGWSGPWMVETQTMHVDYWRFPVVQPSGLQLNLSAASYPLHIGFTDFWVRVMASYEVRKTYTQHASAVETHTQLFGYQADNTDQEGMTYYGATGLEGNLPASALGCDGSIFTSRSWYNRRLWQNTIDTELAEYMASAANNIVTEPAGLTEAMVFRRRYDWMSPVTNPLTNDPYFLITPMPGGMMMSTYDPDEDYMKTFLPQILDRIADKIKIGSLNSFNTEPGRQVPHYDKIRHEYTTVLA